MQGGNIVEYSSEGQLTIDTLEKQVEVLKKLLGTNHNGYFKIKIHFSDSNQEVNDD